MPTSSPRTWGCFRYVYEIVAVLAVFPTHVGVFLRFITKALSFASLPHARGGVSCQRARPARVRRSSPRTWGCFFFLKKLRFPLTVFPTHVGVFLACIVCTPFQKGLPHARGGVSYAKFPILSSTESSPRTWGCFQCFRIEVSCRLVFPTHVGVFPLSTISVMAPVRLPHARGGVSATSRCPFTLSPSSPRTWGCFYEKAKVIEEELVFPTHVGVFLMNTCSLRSRISLPHARGGVSGTASARRES